MINDLARTIICSSFLEPLPHWNAEVLELKQYMNNGVLRLTSSLFVWSEVKAWTKAICSDRQKLSHCWFLDEEKKSQYCIATAVGQLVSFSAEQTLLILKHNFYHSFRILFFQNSIEIFSDFCQNHIYVFMENEKRVIPHIKNWF